MSDFWIGFVSGAGFLILINGALVWFIVQDARSE